jgi:branched-chain amino acid transport system permease protein
MLRRWRQRVTATDLVVWGIGLLILIVVIYGSFATLRSGKYTLANWVDLTIRGLAQGGVYALIAMGYTLVYGILKMINFAHSEVFMSGPFTAVFLAQYLDKIGLMDWSPFLFLLLIMILSMAVSLTIAVLLERVAYRPLRGAPRLVPLITAIGASFFLQYTFRGLYGSGVQAYPLPELLQQNIQLGQFRIFNSQLLVIVAAFVMMIILFAIVQYTKIGKAMRAVSEDKEVAALMGIDVDRVIVFTFMLGGASAGAAGILYAIIFPVVNFIMGFIPGIKAFTAAVLGGIGSVPGAFVGGVLLGLIESIGPNLFLDGLGIPAPYQLKDAIAFVILVFILIFRPTGILGERMTQAKA